MTPSKPISPSLGINSDGKREASSHSITCGAISDSANSRTLRRRCCCSSVKEKSTGPQASFRAYGRTNYLYHRGASGPRQPSQMGSEVATRYRSRKRFNTEFADGTERLEPAQCISTYLQDAALIPADLVARVLLVEPLFERREIIEDRGGVHLALAGHGFEGVGPGAALTHRQHLGELRSGRFVAVNRAAMERACVASLFAKRAVKLELQNKGQEITRVRNIGGHVILRAGIEVGLGSWNRRGYPLIFTAKFPPGFVVIGGLDFARENFPAPLVDQQAERKEGDFLERALEQQGDVSGRRRNAIDQADFLQVFRRNREGDGIADGFVETVVGAVLEKRRQVVVRTLVEIVAELVVNRGEVLGVRLDTHFDPQIIFVVNTPGAGVADDIAIARLREERAFPKCRRQRLETERLKKGLAVV